MPTPSVPDTLDSSVAVRQHAMRALFDQFDSLYEGAIAVDCQGRISWIDDKYMSMLGLRDPQQVLGRDIEQVIPNSLLREVIRTAQPILLDIMEFGQQSFVVTRLPLCDAGGAVVGAVGFVLYERLAHLKPLVAKFASLQQELDAARRGLAEHRRAKYTLEQFVGDAPATVEIKRQATRAAQRDVTVLLLGETGTGKEILANAIHAMSARAGAPFIGVNMAAVPESLLEAEFFGVAPGAYTGADKKAREGKFKLADGGTLFLDEIGDMPLPVQGKLLRVLQEQEIELLGSNKVVKIDVRVIAATSVDLPALVAQGRFRSDLYYRLNVLPIQLPPMATCRPPPNYWACRVRPCTSGWRRWRGACRQRSGRGVSRAQDSCLVGETAGLLRCARRLPPRRCPPVSPTRQILRPSALWHRFSSFLS